MGFVVTAGTVGGDRQPSARTFPESVGRIMVAAGLIDPGTVESPGSNNVIIAKAAVNDALERIWSAAMWRWRYRWVLFDIEDLRFLYDLPGDFVFPGSNLLCFKRGMEFKYMDYHTLLMQYPQLAFVPYEQRTDGGLSYAGRISEFFTADDTIGLTGIPSWWFIAGDKMGLFPVPNRNNANEDQYDDLVHNVMGYYGSFVPLETDSDTLPLPPELLVAHHYLALSQLKQALEFPDFQADEARGERLLRKEVTRSKLYAKDRNFGFINGQV